MIKIVIGMENDAFANGNKCAEVARILDVASGLVTEKLDTEPLYDANGGVVGALINEAEVNISHALMNAKSRADVAALVNEGTREGMEFTCDQLAGQYALYAASERRDGYIFDADGIDTHLKSLRDAGGVFDSSKANAHAFSIASSGMPSKFETGNHFVLTLDTANEAFAVEDFQKECYRIIQSAAETVQGLSMDFKLQDSSGNVVGAAKEVEGLVATIVDAPAQGLYSELLAAGVKLGNHESDLYVPVTKETTEILAKYPLEKSNATVFKSNIDGVRTYDVPFAYEPYWEKPSLKAAEKIASQKESFAPVDICLDKKYEGKVLGVTDSHLVLSLGRSALIVRKCDLDRVPAVDENMSVKFTGGRGGVEPAKSLDIGR